jgi:hypothetical protein
VPRGLAVAVSLLAACGGTDARDGGEVGSGIGSLSSTTTGHAAESTTGERLDLGGIGDVPSGPVRCEKVDLVFVVDNSASMFDEQQSLLQSFPSFIGEVEQVLGSDDYQVLVIDTDVGEWAGCYEAMYGSFDCGLWCSSANCPSGCDCECNAEPCAPFVNYTCDGALGAGRIESGDGSTCGLAGRRYITGADADPSSEFQCAALVGIAGEPNERPMQALVDAVGPLAAADGCNAGFLRADAILVVVVISDEEDQASFGEPVDWYQAVVDAKLGNPAAVVVLGLLGDPDVANGVCGPFDPVDNSGAVASPRLREWVESFPSGDWASVCNADYAPFFQAAISVIDEVCEDFVPPG